MFRNLFKSNIKVRNLSNFVFNQSRAYVSAALPENKCPAYNDNEKQQGKNQMQSSVSWEDALPYKRMPGPFRLPFFGVAHHFLPGGKYYNISILEMHKMVRDEYGDIVFFGSIPGRKDIIMCFDPDDIEYVFRTEGKWPIRRGMEVLDYYRKNIRPETFKKTGGLLIEEGERWQDARTKINPIMLQPKIVRSYISSIDEIAFEFIDKLKKILDSNNETPTDFFDELNNYALEAITCIAMETRLGLLKDDLNKNLDAQHLIKTVHDFFDLMYQLDVLPSMWKIWTTPSFVKIMKVADSMTNLTMKFIDAAIERIDNSKNISDSNRNVGVLEKLYRIDRNLAVVMALDMLMAGVDTTSGATVTLLYLLAKNPVKQQILRNEVIQILPEKNSLLTSESMKNMPYLRACIRESMRLHPVAPGNMRVAGKDIVIKGYKIPKGTEIALNTPILQVDEKYFKRAKEFIPERWLRQSTDEELNSAKIAHPFVYLPFGFGPRTCIGKRFAEMEIEILLIRIIRNFNVEWHYPDVKYGKRLLNIPSGDLKFKLSELEK